MSPKRNSARRKIGAKDQIAQPSWIVMMRPSGTHTKKAAPTAHTHRRSSQRGFGSQANAPTSATKPRSRYPKARFWSGVMAEQYIARGEAVA